MTRKVPLIYVDNVTRTFDEGGVTALRGVSLAIYPGDCVAILGKSGSGKSSLIQIMGGCDTPSSGQVIWREEPVRDQREWQMLRASEIGIIFQEFLLLPALTAIENVEMALMGRGVPAKERTARATRLLEIVGLGQRLRHLPSALSGGERQRVAIARSLANNPALLLADEPTGNLDSVNASAIVDLLLELQKMHGTALVMVTHDESLAARCRRRVLIKDGLIIDDGLTPQQPAAASDAPTTSGVSAPAPAGAALLTGIAASSAAPPLV